MECKALHHDSFALSLEESIHFSFNVYTSFEAKNCCRSTIAGLDHFPFKNSATRSMARHWIDTIPFSSMASACTPREPTHRRDWSIVESDSLFNESNRLLCDAKQISGCKTKNMQRVILQQVIIENKAPPRTTTIIHLGHLRYASPGRVVHAVAHGCICCNRRHRISSTTPSSARAFQPSGATAT
jgi:hypothetical protein